MNIFTRTPINLTDRGRSCSGTRLLRQSRNNERWNSFTSMVFSSSLRFSQGANSSRLRMNVASAFRYQV